jgi:hypothetical protein
LRRRSSGSNWRKGPDRRRTSLRPDSFSWWQAQKSQRKAFALLDTPCSVSTVRPSPLSAKVRAARWSSLVARRAHNPKVAGSNPARATQSLRGVSSKRAPRVFHSGAILGPRGVGPSAILQRIALGLQETKDLARRKEQRPWPSLSNTEANGASAGSTSTRSSSGSVSSRCSTTRRLVATTLSPPEGRP